MLLLTLSVWVASYISNIHVGTWIDETDPYGTTRHYRRGLFIAEGRVCYAYGTDVDWPFEGARKPAARSQGRGVFFGRFGYWSGPDSWPLGFGHASGGASAPTLGRPSKLGDVTRVSSWIGAWVALFLVLPLWRWIAHRKRVQQGGAAVVLTAYSVIAILGMASIVSPGLAAVLLFAAIIAFLVAVERLWLTPWLQERARVRAGRCRICGYDLRATPDPGGPLLERCPECGTYTSPLHAH
jgi:hypothetical protein